MTEPALFRPLHLAGLTLANRITVSPMCQYSATDGLAGDWHRIHYGGLAMSGAALVILEATAVLPEGRITHGCLGLWNEAQTAAMADLRTALRRVSTAAVGVQLGHAGRKASCRSIFERWKGESLPANEGAWQTLAPSAIPFDDGWHCPAAMTEAQIAEVIAAHAAAAARADAAGFDLVEIHAAHGYLIHSFLSPLTNQRRDAWGGDQAARNRLLIEIVRATRAAWPRGKPLGVRLNACDFHAAGLSDDDAVALAQQLGAEGLDYVVMSVGQIAPDVSIPVATPGHQVPFAARIRQETGLTAMAVGQILDGPQANAVIAAGEADLVAIGRGMLDDPRWGWHAAAALGADLDYPAQYLRARPNNWSAYRVLRPETPEIHTARQADRPASAAWDRPAGPARQE